MNTTTLDAEGIRRAQVWERLLASGGPTDVERQIIENNPSLSLEEIREMARSLGF
jgi:hypothetical protein